MIGRLGAWSRGCLTMQGYGALTDADRRRLWLGLRFAPLLCFSGIAVGTVLASPAVPLLAVAAVVTTTNWCLPSLIYGLLHGRRGNPRLS